MNTASVTINSKEREEIRRNWHQKALKSLENAELIYVDPDNWIIGSKKISNKDSEKYVSPREIGDYYKRG